MRYVSTRGQAPSLSFEEAMLTGLARDGGLYVPETVPMFDRAQIAAMAGQPYEEVAFRVMRPFIGDAFTEDEFRGLIAKAYASFAHPARAPLNQIGANHHLRQSLVFLNMPVLQQPEAYIGGLWEMFDEAGNVKSEDTRKFLKTIAHAFSDLIKRTYHDLG